jgi:hypothetical protein
MLEHGSTNVPNDELRAWLDHILAVRRGVISNWFHQAVRGGHRTPQAVLTAIHERCHWNTSWRGDPDGPTGLQALATDPEGALRYAHYVIMYEALPYQERQKLKAARARTYLKNAMQGKPTAPLQLRYLESLGWRGEPPADRAAASALIDQLRQKRGH